MTATDAGATAIGNEHPAAGWALSPSRAGDFMTCPLLYRFRVIDHLPEPPSAVATRGTLVHSVLERLFDRPAAERDLPAALELLEPEWQRLCAERPELADLFTVAQDVDDTGSDDADDAARDDAVDLTAAQPSLEVWLASARALIERYFSLEDPRRVEPAERELLVEVELDDAVRLRGYVDRLDIAPTGQLRIVDYKTGKAPSELFEDKALFQLKFYALVMWRVRGVVPSLLQLMYLGDGQVLRYAPDEADLLATERKVRALWAAIDRALRSRDFPARPGRMCEWCNHHAFCPSFDGTPPPYPEPAGAASVPLPVDVPSWVDDVAP